MVCIENMKEICPVSLHRKIEATLMNLQGAKPEVSALCTDDNIYERELQFHHFFLWFICDNLHGLDVWVGQIILAAATKFFTRRNNTIILKLKVQDGSASFRRNMEDKIFMVLSLTYKNRVQTLVKISDVNISISVIFKVAFILKSPPLACHNSLHISK